MADESDREQGLDLKENLIADNIYPDMPVEKKEVLNYYDTEFESTPNLVLHEKLDEDKKPQFEERDTMSKTFTLQYSVLPNTETSGNQLLKCNKIILGSRPNRESVDEDDLRPLPTPYQLADVNTIENGKENNRIAVNANYFEELVNCCSEPNVLLQDIKSYLLKSKRFCEVCCILFPEPSGYDSHIEIYHAENVTAPNVGNKSDNAKRVQYKCSICAKKFVASHVLRRHVKNIHKVNETQVNENIEKETGSHSNFTDLSNACFHCKKSFDTQKSLIEHLYDILQMKRKETEIVPVLKSVLFKCNKCDINFTSSQFAAGHAEHMEMLVNWKCGICNRIFKKEDELSHERQHSASNYFVVHNLGEIDVSKILFKCSKCGVHFSESNFLYHFRDCGLEATKSVYCNICDILLDYNTLHGSDKHTELNNFTIICTDVISDRPVKSIVKETPDKVTELNNCTIISTDVISDNPHKSTLKETQTIKKLKELLKSFREVKVVVQKIDSSKPKPKYNKNDPTNLPIIDTVQTHNVQIRKESKLWRTSLSTNKKLKNTGQKYRWNRIKHDILEVVNKKVSTNVEAKRRYIRENGTQAFFYCDTCKCFITTFRKEVHRQGLCINCEKHTCELCGLIMTRNSLMTHRRLHESKKDLQLKNFRFYDLYNGRCITPPVPAYPKCTTCAVRFLTKSARQKHVCSEETYLSCDICKMKLSKAAFKLHMPFHQYSIDDMNTVENMQYASIDQSTLPLNIEKTATSAAENDIGLNDSLNDVEMPLQSSLSDTVFHDPLHGVDMPLQNSLGTTSHVAGVELDMQLQKSSSDTVFHDPLHVVDMPLQNSLSGTTSHVAGVNHEMQSQKSLSDTVLHDPLHVVNMLLQNSLSGTTSHVAVVEHGMQSQKSSSDTVLHDPLHVVDMPLQNSLSGTTSHVAAVEHGMQSQKSSSDTVLHDPLDGDNMPLQNISTLSSDQREEVDTQLPNSSLDTELPDLLDEVDMQMQDSSTDSYRIIYTCSNCSVSVDKYDRAIEHCQGHYKSEVNEILTEVCTDCNLKFEKTCYTEHQNLHKLGNEFKCLKFDSYYLPAENDLWIKHIFKTLPNEKVLNILRKSIYRYECRIKMDVVQPGDPHLTVYKCDQCSCFIEPNSLFKHSDNSCFKLRQHPCSHCGLRFISSTSRIKHEEIHNRPGVTIDSYRIVIFNRGQDKQINRSFCLRKKYVLYKCRLCDVIIDKSQRDIHQCDFNNVKKCSYCALLLHSNEYEKHINAHNELVSFNYSNMKVIILGEDNASIAPNRNILKSTFKGAIYDYKMYICNKCEICIKNDKFMAKHVCNFETQRSKCSKCGIYFSVGRLKTHLRSHERDPDFLRSNMNIMSFDPCTLDKNKNATVKFSEECEDSNTDSDSDIVLASIDIGEKQQSIKSTASIIEEKTAKIFKCPCALHFLNEDSIFRHFGVCKSKANISRHKCPKCDLLFTPNILFTHLLAHHSNKSRRYKYDIVEMDNTQISMLQR